MRGVVVHEFGPPSPYWLEQVPGPRPGPAGVPIGGHAIGAKITRAKAEDRVA